ncbi:MAG: hypothetical protein Q9174_004845 [Haloplaca sp. 1 TL-2023]
MRLTKVSRRTYVAVRNLAYRPKNFHSAALFTLAIDPGTYEGIGTLEKCLKWGMRGELPDLGYQMLGQTSQNKGEFFPFDIENNSGDPTKMTEPRRSTLLSHLLALRIMERQLGHHVAKLDEHKSGGPMLPTDDSVQLAVDNTEALKKKSAEWQSQLMKLWWSLE